MINNPLLTKGDNRCSLGLLKFQVALADLIVKNGGARSRSQFIRDAMQELMDHHGVMEMVVTGEMILALEGGINIGE